MSGGSLDGRTALVTGGGRGIGRGIVDRFLAEGARVAVLQRGGIDAELAARDDVLAVQVDLSDTAALAPAVAEVADWGGIDVLVNNAGVMFERSVDELTVDEWNRMIAVNVTAPLFLVQAALPHLAERGGSIINVGSIEGLAANPLHAAYCASKGAVHAMSKALAVDLGARGIRCNAIAPGWIESELSEAYLAERPAGARAALLELHPAGRLGVPDDIGDVAVFLASEASGFMTGQVLVVDGGRTSRLPTP